MPSERATATTNKKLKGYYQVCTSLVSFRNTVQYVTLVETYVWKTDEKTFTIWRTSKDAEKRSSIVSQDGIEAERRDIVYDRGRNECFLC